MKKTAPNNERLVENMLRAVDLCCGGGGWACAARGLPIQIIAAADLWEPACRTYALNHRGTIVMQGDLRSPEFRAEFFTRSGGNIDVVLGGIPCEWLSVYRNLQKVKPEELEQQRETLDCVLALSDYFQPRWWCLEDVIQLKRELPIFTPYVVLDARHWSAQRRKRLFVGRFPKPRRPNVKLTLGDVTRPGPYRIGRRLYGRKPQFTRTFANDTCLAAPLDRKGPTVLSQCSRRDAEMAILDPSVPGGMRNPEWQEMAALQGFPTDYLFYGSPSDVMKMVGRAVQIDLARAILQGIVDEWKTPPAETTAGKSKVKEPAHRPLL
ncbi:MAG: DNA cytosine methyltransferase [Patescibacteria group bacterium]|nr:DNA cytosine methyltransferase [Patescibacteria group bacterium]